MAFRFLDNIALADVAFEARGATRDELFRACGAALLRTMVADSATVARRHEYRLELADPELDLLLFAFLQELVYLKDAQQLLLHADEVAVTGEVGAFRLAAVVRGEVIDRQRHPLLVDVKAVTLHRFRVVQEAGVWRATVVLDV